MKLNLNNNQALRAGICFANMFGIYAKDEEIFNNGDTIAYPLFYKDKNIGYISIRNKKVLIRTTNKNFELFARYDIPYASGMEDAESSISGIVYADWKNKIECLIRTKERMEIRGDIILSCSGDLEFGTKCTLHTDLNITNSSLGNFNLIFNNRGNNFSYSNKNKQFEENIEVSFLQESIFHSVASDFDKDKQWHTRKVDGAIIQKHSEIRAYSRLQKTSDIDGYIYDSAYNENIKQLVGHYGDIEQLIQLANEAQHTASKMPKQIQQIRECLKFNNTYFFDYLVNAMFNNNELTNAIFGYIPQNINYQNGENNLKDAYFGDFSQNNNLLGK